jgi:hypothetical protein
VSIYKEEQARNESYTTNVDKSENKKAIINSRNTVLQDKITTKLHTRYDTSRDDNLWDNNYPLPRYVYEGQEYSYPKSKPTIPKIDAFSQGAYYNPDKNRIEYNSQNSDNTIEQQRTWRTAN